MMAGPQASRQQQSLNNTVMLNMVINLTMKTSLEYLNKGMELELFSNHELYMLFNYTRMVYQMLFYNRKPIIQSLNEDLNKLDMIDMSDLNSSAEQFKARRRKAKQSQKLVYDEFEYYKALFSIYGGMTLLIAYCSKQGFIPNSLFDAEKPTPIEKMGVERTVYEQRFAPFQMIPFPKFISYEEYRANFEKDCSMDAKQLADKAKQLFIDGKNVL